MLTVTDARNWRRKHHVKISIERLGIVTMRPYLTINEYKKFGFSKNMDSRLLTANMMAELIQSPEHSAENLLQLDDAMLESLAQAWILQMEEPRWQPIDETSVYNVIQQNFYRESDKIIEAARQARDDLVNVYVQSIATQLPSIVDTVMLMLDLHKSLNLMIEAVRSSLQQNYHSLIILQEASFESLPNLSDVYTRINVFIKQESVKVRVIVDELNNDGAYLAQYWRLNDIVAFYGVDDLNPKVKSAAITNRLLAQIRKPEFIETLKSYFFNSTVLRRRWPIIEVALLAHVNRQYAISIPTLLAQFEGVFTDILAVKGIGIMHNGYLCERDSNGELSLNDKGKPIRITTLNKKMRNYKSWNDAILQDFAKFYVNGIIAERNGILHGRIVKYSKAKLSAQLIRYIYVMAAEFNALENPVD